MIKLPTSFGEFKIDTYENGSEECIIISKDYGDSTPFVRIHSSCVFSESLLANDCDCAQQLHASLKYISEHGGIVIYCYEEGRGIGLKNKIRAIQLEQQKKLNTADAFKQLGFPPDPRNYKTAVDALLNLNIKKIRLATGNPQKKEAIEKAGIEVTERVTVSIDASEVVQKYVEQKVKVLGHYEKN